MDKPYFMQIAGSITYSIYDRIEQADFSEIAVPEYDTKYNVYYIKCNYGDSLVINICISPYNIDTGLTINGTRYFGKDMHAAYAMLKNRETTEILNSLN